MAGFNKDLSSSFMDSFSCKICFEVLDDPVQCQNNEHYFCRKCVTEHVENSETCPTCMDQLTLETLRPPSRIILEIVSQFKKPRCRHVSRGCTENVEVEDVLLHEQMCGYAPVVCSNEGCKETVNRRDQESHETKECKFRKITCESCDEELVCIDFERHQCTLRKEINEITLRLNELTKSLLKLTSTQAQVLEKLEVFDQSIKDLQNPLRRVSSTKLPREATLISGQVFIFGGYGDPAMATSLLKFSTGQQRRGRCSKIVYFSDGEIRMHSFTGRESWCVEVSTQTESSSSTQARVGSLRVHFQQTCVVQAPQTPRCLEID